MKPRKIKRNHSFRRRSPFHHAVFPWKTVLGTLALIALVVGGVFTAKWLASRVPAEYPSASLPAESGGASEPTAGPTGPTEPEQPTLSAERAFYVPVSALRDLTGLEKTLRQAAAAGFGAMVFDLKDETGRVWYASASASAAKAKSVAADALTAEQLSAVRALCEGQGIVPVPRLYAFRDQIGAENMQAARVQYTGDPSVIWLDDYYERGGKPWLNPYSTEAQTYLTDLIAELRTQGFARLMLSGVQFPEKTYYAYFGSSTQPKGEVLSAFVQAARTAFGDGTVVLQMPAAAAMGTDTTAFGDNPLNFGEATAAVQVIPSELAKNLKVGEAVIADPAAQPAETVRRIYEQIGARLRLMEEKKRPALQLWIAEDTYAAETVRSLAETDGVVLYSADGVYDFPRYER